MFAATISPWYLPTCVSCQMPVMSPTAHRRFAGAQLRVDWHAARVGHDADRLEPQPLDARPPAGRDEQTVAVQLVAVVEHNHVVVAVAPRGLRSRVHAELDPIAVQRLQQRTDREHFAHAHRLQPDPLRACPSG